MSLGKLINRILMPLGLKISKLPSLKNTKNKVNVYDLTSASSPELSRETQKILNLLNYTKKSGTQYAATHFNAGYHSITIEGKTFDGQRNPSERLNLVPFDFHDATVLDIGCNQGGMLFELSKKLRHGVGIDCDYRMVNAANRVSTNRGSHNIDFFVINLETESLDLIDNFLPEEDISIVFLLSVCMWIKNWHQVVDKAASLSKSILFESNGSEKQQEEQERYLRTMYKKVTLVSTVSSDDPSQKERRLFLGENVGL